MSCLAMPSASLSPFNSSMPMSDLDRLLFDGALYPVYQPIFRLDDMRLIAHEGLIRERAGNSARNPLAMLDLARSENRLGEFELTAARVVANGFGLPGQDGRLFVNISAQALLQGDQAAGELIQSFASSGADPARFVVELTEHDIIRDISLIAEAVRYLRASGIRIALDDFGSGHSNFEMWHELAPDYVKIDRYLVDGIRVSPGRLAIVRALVDMATALGTQLIAEGIEHEGDLRLLRDLGIRYGQGFLLGVPKNCAVSTVSFVQHRSGDPLPVRPLVQHSAIARHVRVQHLLIEAAPVAPSMTNAEVARVFYSLPALHALPVVADGIPVGLINRRTFMERFAQPFIRELHERDACSMLMSAEPVICDAEQPIEDMADVLLGPDQRYLSDGFIITRQGRYAGIGTGEALVRRVTELRIEAARHANPLTLLPGNIPVTQHIARLLTMKHRFAAAYFDLNQFKPFNDRYGYCRGDEVIRLVAALLTRHVDDAVDFIGHVGGDDFVVLLQSVDWRNRCESVVREFNLAVRSHFDAEDLRRNGFEGEDRSGRHMQFPLTTLAVGVALIGTDTALEPEDIASLAASAKRQAKHSGDHLAVVGESPRFEGMVS